MSPINFLIIAAVIATVFVLTLGLSSMARGGGGAATAGDHSPRHRSSAVQRIGPRPAGYYLVQKKAPLLAGLFSITLKRTLECHPSSQVPTTPRKSEWAGL
jgi:hypothetical protein